MSFLCFLLVSCLALLIGVIVTLILLSFRFLYIPVIFVIAVFFVFFSKSARVRAFCFVVVYY